MGMAFIDRAGPILGDLPRLQESLSNQMRRIKKFKIAYALNLALDIAGYWRGCVAWLVVPRLTWKCSATAVLSNLGEIFKGSSLPRTVRGQIKAGPLQLLSVELLPPLRAYTNLSIGVVTYGEKLVLSAHYDHTILDAKEIQNLLRHMGQHLRVNLSDAQEDKASYLVPLRET
jgi:hypothetical protein